MTSRTAVINILLACCSFHKAVAVTWGADTCPIEIEESKSKDNLHTFAANGTSLTYTIETQSVEGRFVISSNGILSSETKLDFESDEKSYTVEIMATENGQTPKTDVLNCEIKVKDVNDEVPTFDQESYSVDILNDVAKGTSVLTVAATDGDVSAEFNKIVFSIKVGGDGDGFIIDNGTGVISANKLLTAEVPPTLNLTVIASDNTFTTEANVTVCVGCKRSGSTAPGISLFASMALVLSVLLM